MQSRLASPEQKGGVVVLEGERDSWRPGQYGWREGATGRGGESYAPMRMGENQIADLLKGRRYEDAMNIPPSDCRQLPRRFW